VETKALTITEFKADDDSRRRYTALVSVFGNVDAYGDRVHAGAFSDTLDEWAKSASAGHPMPVVYSHGWNDPRNLIGTLVDAEERTRGNAKGLLTVNELHDEEFPQTVYRRLKDGTLNQHSFAYEVHEAEHTEKDGVYVRELKRLELIETGPCVRGVNSATRTIDVKALDEALRAAGLPSAEDWQDVVKHLGQIAEQLGVVLSRQPQGATGGGAGDRGAGPHGTQKQDGLSMAAQRAVREAEIDRLEMAGW
jgi:HK97 family phage prohead protease